MRIQRLLIIAAFVLCVVPALAQEEGERHTLMYDGFGFSYDAALGANVNITHYAGDNPADSMPAGPDAAWTQFTLYDDAPAPTNLFDGGVRVYRIDDARSYMFHVQQINVLNYFVQEQIDLAQFEATTPNGNDLMLPFLPPVYAVQVMRARAAYVETDALRGIAYVSAFRQDVYPFRSGEFVYTFQGMSLDDRYYVSAVFPLETPLFPDEIAPDLDYDAFIENLQPYFAESIATLNAADASDFTPPLDTLDALIDSISFTD